MSEGIRQTIKELLIEKGFDGLYNSDDECGCTIDDLMPCDQPHLEDCLPGYKHKMDPEETESGFDYLMSEIPPEK